MEEGYDCGRVIPCVGEGLAHLEFMIQLLQLRLKLRVVRCHVEHQLASPPQQVVLCLAMAHKAFVEVSYVNGRNAAIGDKA